MFVEVLCLRIKELTRYSINYGYKPSWNEGHGVLESKEEYLNIESNNVLKKNVTIIIIFLPFV